MQLTISPLFFLPFKKNLLYIMLIKLLELPELYTYYVVISPTDFSQIWPW